LPSKSSVERSMPIQRYDISRLRNCVAHVSAHAIHAHADCLSLHRSTYGRTVLRPLQRERSAGDADDNRTALYAPPIVRFTELGMSVSLPIFIQLRKDNGRRRISHSCHSRLNPTDSSCPEFCRFLDAGMTNPSARCGGRRPKSAKARSRGRLGTGGAAGAMGV
jgi:hypothetical protein